MKLQSFFKYCLSKAGAYVDFPFGEIPAVIKLNGRIFAEIYDRQTKPQITLKCDPVLAGLLRQKYPGIIIPGYHVPNRNKPYWNTVLLDNVEVPEREILEMIDDSYNEVVKKYKKTLEGDLQMNNEIKEKSLALITRSFTCILGTIDENGTPQMKALIKTAGDGLREFWFCSNTSSRRVKQIQVNSSASLYFFDEKTFEGLMLAGNAEVSYDDAKRSGFWSDGMERYYPLGCTDPDFALIKFTAYKGNYYHGLVNTDFDI